MVNNSAQKKQKTKTALDIQFPDTSVVINGRAFSVNPIPARQFPQFLRTFIQVALLIEEKRSPFDIIETLGDSIMDMLNVCIAPDSIDELPMTVVPDLLERFIELNFSEEVMGKFVSLLQKMIALMPGGKEALEQAKQGI